VLPNSFIVLDRDGVINEDSDQYIKSPEEWLPLPGSLEAISLLHRAGYRVVVATNQSGIARGLFDEITLARIHQKMADLVEAQGGRIEGVFYCPHGPDDDCKCRKPRPGLIEEICSEFETDLLGCYLIGDSLRDIQAAVSAGLTPVLVRTGKGTETESRLLQSGFSDIPVFDDLLDAVKNLGLVHDD